jgi:hypothetical protein
VTDTHSEKLGFEPFGTVDGVLRGEPIKIMPVGKFYRDNRVIDITESDLQEIERNTAAGLPRFRIPINENHGTDGKVGTVNKVKYLADGPEGKGLYATDYSLTPAGQAAIKARKWDAVSPEMVWQKNGATYQDPQTGQQHTNVLVGLALCDKPFFSHEHVALFTADAPAAKPQAMMMDQVKDHLAQAAKLHQAHLDGTEPTSPASQKKLMAHLEAALKALGMREDMSADMPRRGNGYTAMRGKVKSFIAELEKYLVDEDGDGVPDGEQMPEDMPGGMTPEMKKKKQQMHPEGMAVQPVAANVTQPAAEAASQGVETMADEKPTPPAAEQMAQAVSADEFAAVKAANAALTQRLAQVELAARQRDMAERVDAFVALGAEKSELTGHLLKLQDAAPAEFEYFHGLLKTVDALLAERDLFAQVADGRPAKPARGAETFADAVQAHLDKHFDGDMAKYAEAADAVARAKPELYKASR